MNNSWAIIISSCDAYSDLWDLHLSLFLEHWIGPLPKIYLITDKPTNHKYKNVSIAVLSGDCPERIKSLLETIDEKYVLITLDDYFLIHNTYCNSIEFVLNHVESNHVDYLCLYDRRFARGFGYRKKNVIKPIDLNENYAVNLYPAIWNKEFFIKCVDDDISPWEFEPTLTSKAVLYNAKCEIDLSGRFIILDVIRKGKILHKANRYFKKNNITLNGRPIVKRSYEFKLWIMDFIRFYTPKWFSKFVKKIASKFGYRFYSK